MSLKYAHKQGTREVRVVERMLLKISKKHMENNQQDPKDVKIRNQVKKMFIGQMFEIR